LSTQLFRVKLNFSNFLGFNIFLILIFAVFVADDPHFDRMFKMIIFTKCFK